MAEVLVYLAAIVAANVSVATWGPAVSILNALLFVGLDLTLRDRLHWRWHEQGQLHLRMGALIVAAGVLSYIATPGAGPIAVASAVAWACASATDTVVFHLLAVVRGRPAVQAVTTSNAAAAAVDSLLFPTLAFGALLPLVVLGQFAAKVLGGALWLMVFRALSDRRAAA